MSTGSYWLRVCGPGERLSRKSAQMWRGGVLSCLAADSSSSSSQPPAVVVAAVAATAALMAAGPRSFPSSSLFKTPLPSRSTQSILRHGCVYALTGSGSLSAVSDAAADAASASAAASARAALATSAAAALTMMMTSVLLAAHWCRLSASACAPWRFPC